MALFTPIWRFQMQGDHDHGISYLGVILIIGYWIKLTMFDTLYSNILSEP